MQRYPVNGRGRGRPVITLPSATVVFLSDSNAAESYGFLHPWTWTIGLNGGVLKPIANSSVAGNTIADMLARIDNLYTDSSPGLAGTPEPITRLWLRSGTNNARGGATINSTDQANYVALIAKCLTYSPNVDIFPVPPISSPESGAGVNSFNSWLQSYCATDSRLLWVDDCVTVNDGTGSWASGYAGGDGVHIPNQSSFRMGIDGGTDPALVAALAGYASPLITDPLDVYPASSQWIVNPFMTGTGGSTGGLSGVVADNWSIGRSGSGLEGTAYKVTDSEGVWQGLSPTQITDNGVDGGFGISATLAHAAITTLVPNILDFVMKIRFVDFHISKFRYGRAGLNGNNNEELAPPTYLRMGDSGTFSGTCVLRGALRRSGTRQSHTSASGVFGLCPSTSFTGAMGSIEFQLMSIRTL